MILGAHKRKLAKGELSAILFVDNTDVIHFNMKKNETPLEAHAKLQESVESLGKLLMSSGDALNQPSASTTSSPLSGMRKVSGVM